MHVLMNHYIISHPLGGGRVPEYFLSDVELYYGFCFLYKIFLMDVLNRWTSPTPSVLGV